jgi:hypothetical protein
VLQCNTLGKDEVLNFRVPADLESALKKAAGQDERSMSMMAVRILREGLAESGFLRVQKPTSVKRPRSQRAR